MPERTACVFRAAAMLLILMPSHSRPGFIMLHETGPTKTWLLTAGEERLMQVSAGSRWVAARGDVLLTEPPRWLGERLVGIQLVLHDGAEHVVERGGWVALRALSDGALVCETRAPLTRLLAAVWRIIRHGHRTRALA
jgi:hypothetical protein